MPVEQTRQIRGIISALGRSQCSWSGVSDWPAVAVRRHGSSGQNDGSATGSTWWVVDLTACDDTWSVAHTYAPPLQPVNDRSAPSLRSTLALYTPACQTPGVLYIRTRCPAASDSVSDRRSTNCKSVTPWSSEQHMMNSEHYITLAPIICWQTTWPARHAANVTGSWYVEWLAKNLIKIHAHSNEVSFKFV